MAATLLGCAALQGDTPLFLSVGLLVGAGAMRSMQMTSLNTLAFADIEPAQARRADPGLAVERRRTGVGAGRVAGLQNRVRSLAAEPAPRQQAGPR